jgi:ribosomal protein S27E
MRRSSGNLLVYFTSLLMALSPLQVTATSFSSAPEILDSVIQISAVLVEDTTIFSDFVLDQSCDQCNTRNVCYSYSCTVGSCSGCIMLLSPATQVSLSPVARLEMALTDEGFARLDSDSPFRPPKV